MHENPRGESARDDEDKARRFAVPAPEFISGPFDDTNPKHISQHSLDVTGHALDTEDFDLFAQFFHIPHMIETFAGKRRLRTHEDLRKIFENSIYQAKSIGVTQRVRRCLSAEFRNDTTFVAAHETHLMKGTLLLRDPIPAYNIVERIDGVWRSTFSAYAVDDEKSDVIELLTKHGKPLELSED